MSKSESAIARYLRQLACQGKNIWLQSQIGGEMLIAHTARCASIIDEVLAQAVNQMQLKAVPYLDARIEQMKLVCSIAKQDLAQYAGVPRVQPARDTGPARS